MGGGEVASADGLVIDDADVRRLSPLGFEHINIVGRYSFNLPEEIEHGELRPLQR